MQLRVQEKSFMASAYNLPSSQRVDVQILSKLFGKTTNSYKFVFFLALLDILEFSTKKEPIVLLRDVNVQMLANCWYPHVEFRLSFGRQDQVAKILDDLNSHHLNLNKPISEVLGNNKKYLKESIFRNLDDYSLMRYVPFRLIRPFFSKETRGISDGKVNDELVHLSNLCFDDKKPLYKFTDNQEAIILHQDWLSYFLDNISIVRGWASWKWANYMQSKNQNTSNIINKLFPEPNRGTMGSQRKYWKAILEKSESDVKCIYSGQIIDVDQFALDHYIPWTFLAHNQLWNLIPIPSSVNSSKSNLIPAKCYIDDFVELQYKGIKLGQEIFSEKKWNEYIEPYVVDIGFRDEDELLEPKTFKDKLKPEIENLIYRAENQGFESGWIYAA